MDVHTDADGHVVVSRRTVEGFENRVHAIFGNLQSTPQAANHEPHQSGSALPWALRANVDYSAGKDTAFSSDEEEEAAAHEQMRNEQIPGSDLDLNEEEDENLVKPSLAFCKALENEEEYDQIDEMASRSLGGHPPRDTLPDRRMEVLDNNVYDQRVQQREEAGGLLEETGGPMDGGSTPMDIEQGPVFPLASHRSIPCSQNPLHVREAMEDPLQQQGQVSGNPTASPVASSGEPGCTNPGDVPCGDASQGPATPRRVGARGTPSTLRGILQTRSTSKMEPAEAVGDQPRGQNGLVEGEKPRKRVRFKEPSQEPPHRVLGNADSREAEELEQSRSGGVFRNQRQSRGEARRSYVPDHVLHPERYTMYTLDQPITVGGGGHGPDTTSDLFKAVQSARAAAEQHTPSDMQIDAAPRDLPAFGSGIEFRPKAKSGGPEEDGRAAKASGRPERVTWAHKEEHGPRVRGPAHLDYMDAAALELEEEDGEQQAEGHAAVAQVAGRLTTDSEQPSAGFEPVTFNSRQRQKRNLRGKHTAAEEPE